MGPLFSNGEQWEGFAMGWASLGVPLAVALGLMSSFVAYPIYVSRRSSLGTVLVFLSNVLLVAVVALVRAEWAAGL